MRQRQQSRVSINRRRLHKAIMKKEKKELKVNDLVDVVRERASEWRHEPVPKAAKKIKQSSNESVCWEWLKRGSCGKHQ